MGIVLSGTGSDGALGLKAIKECGGLTIAQGSNGTAPQYGEMPAGAIATGAVDLVAPVEEMPGHLLRLKDRDTASSEPAQDASTVDTLRLEICNILRTQLGHEFSGYQKPDVFAAGRSAHARGERRNVARIYLHDSKTIMTRSQSCFGTCSSV